MNLSKESEMEVNSVEKYKSEYKPHNLKSYLVALGFPVGWTLGGLFFAVLTNSKKDYQIYGLILGAMSGIYLLLKYIEVEFRKKDRIIPAQLIEELEKEPLVHKLPVLHPLSRFFTFNFFRPRLSPGIFGQWNMREVSYHIKAQQFLESKSTGWALIELGLVIFWIYSALFFAGFLKGFFSRVFPKLPPGMILASVVFLVVFFGIIFGVSSLCVIARDVKADKNALESGHFDPEVIQSYLQKLQDRPTDFAAGFAPIRRAMAKYRYEKFLQLLNS